MFGQNTILTSLQIFFSFISNTLKILATIYTTAVPMYDTKGINITSIYFLIYLFCIVFKNQLRSKNLLMFDMLMYIGLYNNVIYIINDRNCC